MRCVDPAFGVGYSVRQSGLPNVGTLSSGTHIVHFYRHVRELMETHATFCQAGLQHNEYCLWIITPPYTEALAGFEFENLSLDVRPYRASGQLEFGGHLARLSLRCHQGWRFLQLWQYSDAIAARPMAGRTAI